MAAPSGIVWGDIKGSYCRIGIYVSLSNTDTKTTASVQVWFWSKYSVYDTNNAWYFSNTGTSAASYTSQGAFALNTTHDSGDGWSTTNQVRLGTFSYSYNRGTSAVKRYLNALFEAVDKAGGNMYASTTFTVPALPTYTISYNANGGSGAPSAQTKSYNKALTLSSTKPTRTGYAFQGWATSASGSVAYAAGASYTANASVTLYAVWKANTYTVSYNANGGSGAPSNQTKTYGTALTLSTTKPTRANYTFLGWATSASATTATYAAGGKYTANAAVTLYAVWELAYVKPIIYNLTADRCDASGAAVDDGTCSLIKFDWECTYDVSSITIAWASASAGSGSATVTASGTSGSVSQIIGDSALSSDASYTITVTVSDSVDNSTATTTLNGAVFPWDAKEGGEGISFGKPAELGKAESLGGNGVADFAYDAKFNQPVYGNALGLNRLPAIPANAELNDYIETGCWAIHSNAIAATITCGGKLLGSDNTVPPAKAGRFVVASSTGEGIRLEQWSYLRQKFMPYGDVHATWERDVARGADNVWNYYDWWKSSLTPAASEKVYHEQKILWSGGYYMTASHTINLSEPISAQPNGIVLTFSRYSSGSLDEQFSHFFIPKKWVATHGGCGQDFKLGGIFNAGAKYLYIHDSKIVGHEKNNQSVTVGGITYTNNLFVLRYVYGV